jgi:hypothetical protein
MDLTALTSEELSKKVSEKFELVIIEGFKCPGKTFLHSDYFLKFVGAMTFCQLAI